jgi:hypothetical protein
MTQNGRFMDTGRVLTILYHIEGLARHLHEAGDSQYSHKEKLVEIDSGAFFSPLDVIAELAEEGREIVDQGGIDSKGVDLEALELGLKLKAEMEAQEKAV